VESTPRLSGFVTCVTSGGALPRGARRRRRGGPRRGGGDRSGRSVPGVFLNHSHPFCPYVTLPFLPYNITCKPAVLLTDLCLPYATPHSPYISPLHLLCCFPFTDPFSPYVTPHSPYIIPTHLYRRSTPRSSPMWSRKRRSGTSSPSTRTASAILDASFVFRLCFVCVSFVFRPCSPCLLIRPEYEQNAFRPFFLSFRIFSRYFLV